ncbi:mobile mystery protein B [Candidatus Omnitrophota bacterium]
MNNFETPFSATPIEADDMEGLKLKHISMRGELDRWEHENISEAMNWLVHRRKKDILTEEFIKKLHQKMFGKVWKWAGKFRRSDKNIGVAWHNISMELRILLDDVKCWIEHKTYSQDEIAVRFHHRLVWMHLFPNGNGRHARLMTDILLKELFHREPFTWNKGSIDAVSETRKLYIQALKHADQNDYTYLLSFVRL